MMVCAAVFLMCLTGAEANSALRYWEGSDSYGLTVVSEDCPLTVTHEDLVFHIREYPQEHYFDNSSFLELKSSVTASYTIHNPSDLTVRADLVFPFGNMPVYMPHDTSEGPVSDTDKYLVTVNGKAVGDEIRYTYSRNEFDLERDLPQLTDTYRRDSFYLPETPVREYTWLLDGVEEAEAAAALRFDRTKTRVTAESLSGGTFSEDEVLLNFRVREGEEIRLYIFGEQPEQIGEWEISTTGPDEVPDDARMRLTGERDFTFLDFVMERKGDDIPAGEVDFFNAFVSRMTDHENSFGVSELSTYPMLYDLIRWRKYSIELAPGETIVNEVSVPLYPDVDAGYKDPKYTYTYLLSPAETWKEFGSLDIVIESDYEMLDATLDGFVREDGAWRLSLDGLPGKELEFTLCRVKSPSHVNNGYAAIILGVLGAAAVCFLVLVWLLIRLVRKLFRRA